MTLHTLFTQKISINMKESRQLIVYGRSNTQKGAPGFLNEQ